MDNYKEKLYDFNKDSRPECRYGEKCYQTNLPHLSKYKHPPKRPQNEAAGGEESSSKRRKIDEGETTGSSDQKAKEVISDSESEDESPKEKNPVSAEKKLSSVNEATTSEKEERPVDHRMFIKQKFLVEMPEDFYQFWEFCKELKPKNPKDALKDVGLILVGPYDVLAGKFVNNDKSDEEFLCHWRYYHDPPEFQTVLKGDDKVGYHIGYFRDSPNDLPACLASNCALKDGTFTKMGDNIFGSLNLYLDEIKKSGDPFKKMFVGKFASFIKNKANELNLNLNSLSEKIRRRETKVIAKTSNRMGIVVPYNRKTELGYRELALPDKDIKTLLDKLKKAFPEQKPKILSELQNVFTYANIAIDECDFGTGLKLGLDILCHGVPDLNATISHFLTTAYTLLDRQAFAKIAETHMKNRKTGCDLEIL